MAEALKLPSGMGAPVDKKATPAHGLILPESMGGAPASPEAPAENLGDTFRRLRPESRFAKTGDLTGGILRGAASTLEESVGGVLGLAPGAVGRAGADLSKFGESQYEKAKEYSPAGAAIGHYGAYALPIPKGIGAVGKGAAYLESLGINPSIAKMLSTSGVSGATVGAITPSDKETLRGRLKDKAYPAAMAATLPVVGAGIGAGVKAVGTKASQLKDAFNLGPIFDKFSPRVDLSSIGHFAQDRLTTKLEALKETREVSAAKDYAEYYAKGDPVAHQVQLKTANDLMTYLNTDKSLTPKTKKFVADSINDLRQPLNTKGLENLRREWEGRAESFDNKGVEAISKDVTDKLSNIMRDNLYTIVPNGAAKRAIDNYTANSKDINLWNTLIGKGSVETRAGEFLPQVKKTSPTDFTKKVFKDTDTYNDFLRLSGDPMFVRDTAKKFIRSELGPNSGRKGIDTFIRDNSWLRQDPILLAEVQKLRDTVSAGESTRNVAKYGGAAAAGSLGVSAVYELLHKLGLR